MEHDPKYTVIVMGKTFSLTKSQVEFDSPNYFTACFLGDFCEAQTRQLELSRDPDLFKLIVRYLCGYSVLPLDEKQIPSSTTPATALADLRADATFYQLDGLKQACDELLANQRPVPREEYMAFLGITSVSGSSSLDRGNVHDNLYASLLDLLKTCKRAQDFHGLSQILFHSGHFP
jgi:hypothetical protein